MDRGFFETLNERRQRFLERAAYPDEQVKVQVVLGNGRVYVLDSVVEAADAWVQLDVRDVDDDQLRSIMLPYYQVHHVLFVKERTRVPQTGFTR